MQLRIQNLYIAVSNDACSGNFLLTGAFNTQDFSFFAFHFQAQSLDVKDDVSNIFSNTGDSSKFMQNSVNFNVSYCGTRKGGEQYTTQAVAQCNAVASFQRFPYKFTVASIIADLSCNHLGFLNFNHAASLLLSRITTIRLIVGWHKMHTNYLEYNSTMRCSSMGTSISSRVGKRSTLPPKF